MTEPNKTPKARKPGLPWCVMAADLTTVRNDGEWFSGYTVVADKLLNKGAAENAAKAYLKENEEATVRIAQYSAPVGVTVKKIPALTGTF